MGTSRISGNSLFALASSSISSSYYYMKSMNNATNGLSLENILNPNIDDKNKAAFFSYLNSTSSQYLARNFNSIDVDKDGIISDADINNYNSQMLTNGLTYNQLAQLCSSGSSNSLLETVLEHFSEIDANGDGRITSAEISAYGVDQEADEIKERYPQFDPSSMSIFYKTSSASTSSKTTDK